MRLRPTQFVFLLLLLCSVQPGESLVRQLTAAAPACALLSAPSPERTQRAVATRYPGTVTEGTTTLACTKSVAARSALASMTPPASSAAAVAHHTSLLRA